jgi:hypothetical protein
MNAVGTPGSTTYGGFPLQDHTGKWKVTPKITAPNNYVPFVFLVVGEVALMSIYLVQLC